MQRRTVREQAEDNRKKIHEEVMIRERLKDNLFKPLTYREIYEHINPEDRFNVDEKTFRRYLRQLHERSLVLHVGHNQYLSNLLSRIITVSHEAFCSNFFVEVDAWDTNAMWELWQQISSGYESIPQHPIARDTLMEQLDRWFNRNYSVYLSTQNPMVGEIAPNFDARHTITNALIELMKAITIEMVALPLKSPKGFKVLIDFDPKPFEIDYEEIKSELLKEEEAIQKFREENMRNQNTRKSIE